MIQGLTVVAMTIGRQTGIAGLGRLRVFALALLWLAVGSSFALADDNIAIGPPESWVEIVPLPKADPNRAGQIQNSISNLLSEFQVKKRGDGYTVFDRYAYRIVDRPGLERGAAVEWTFDPARHKVTLNHLRIIRNGTVIDHLDRAKPDIYRRERDAERGMFDGRLTARINLDDVRVGDIVDYARTFEISPLVGKGQYSDWFLTQWQEPVALIRQKVIWPENQEIFFKKVGTDLDPKVTKNGGETTYLWEIANPEPSRSEANLPAEAIISGYVDMTTLPDWQSLVDMMKPYYAPATEFPADFAQRLGSIEREHAAPRDRMIQALRLVQDEIRYVSLAMGTGSYVPRRPDVVIQSGFGDCKDKALLLVSILKRLGIDAQVALANTGAGFALPMRVPSITAFDHVIVRAVVDGRTYWLDPTNYLQGGTADTLVPPDFGYALPMVDAGAGLEKIHQPLLANPTASVAEHFILPVLPGEALKLSVDTTYRDRDADWMRYRLISESSANIQQKYLEYYHSRFPGIATTRNIGSRDDRDANVVTVSESYELPAAAVTEDLLKDFPLKADINVADLPAPSAVGRRFPIWIGRQIFREHKVKVSNVKARFTALEDGNQRNGQFWFVISSLNTPTEFDLNWRLVTLSDQVPLTAVPAYLKAVDEAARYLELRYDFTYADKPAKNLNPGG